MYLSMSAGRDAPFLLLPVRPSVDSILLSPVGEGDEEACSVDAFLAVVPALPFVNEWECWHRISPFPSDE